MSDVTEPGDSSPLAGARRADQVCDRFETAWQNTVPDAAPPRIEDHLAWLPIEGRDTLLRELVALEVYYRSKRGETPRLQEYLARFPDLDESSLASAFHDQGTPGVSPLPGMIHFDLSTTGLSPPIALGRFTLRRELGRGGFGIVFLAEDTRLGRVVALKVPRPEVLANPELRQRFLREARTIARLDHPNIVPVFDTGEEGGTCYIASAYCLGDNLAAWLKPQTAPVVTRLAAALVAELAGAVQHAHERGILHRDLKPANILLVPREGEKAGGPDQLAFVPKVTDFGLAKWREHEDESTTSGILMGTPAYMAPEQAAGWTGAVGPATDVYGLGVILYELLTRQLPCRGASLLQTLERVRSQEPEPLRAKNAEVSPDLEVICLKCLQKAPGDRYASAAELAADLRRFLDGESIRARPVGPLTRAWRWCRRPEHIRRAALVAFGYGALACVVNLVGVFMVVCGVVPVTRHLPAVLFLLGGCVGFSLPEFWVGRRSTARDVRALWAGLFLPPLLVAYQGLATAGIIPSGEIMDLPSSPSAWFVQMLTVGTLDVVQMAAFTLALLAYYAHRRQPGFLPERFAVPKMSG